MNYYQIDENMNVLKDEYLDSFEKQDYDCDIERENIANEPKKDFENIE